MQGAGPERLPVAAYTKTRLCVDLDPTAGQHCDRRVIDVSTTERAWQHAEQRPTWNRTHQNDLGATVEGLGARRNLHAATESRRVGDGRERDLVFGADSIHLESHDPRSQ